MGANAQNYAVYFDTDKAIILKTQALDSAVALAKSKNTTLRIECHCDNRADSIYNFKLSQRRGQAVQNYLAGQGVKSSVEVRAFGKNNPAFPNTPALRYKNRRCDVFFGEEKSTVKEKPATTEKVIEFVNVKEGDLEPGTRLMLSGLEFVGNQAVPMDYSMEILYQLLQIMRQNPDLTIHIRGHVCCGDDMPLSVARAKAVRDYLVQNSIDSTRLNYSGYSNTEPLVVENSQRDEQKNRRVEVDIANKPKEKAAVALSRSTFKVQLLDIDFKGKTLTYDSEFNLDLLSKMVKNSKNHLYVIEVYGTNKNFVEARKISLQGFFLRRGISKNTLVVIAGTKMPKQTEDSLFLEIKSKQK